MFNFVLPAKCMIVSLQHTPPDDVFAMIKLRSTSLSLKMYIANGLSLNENICQSCTRFDCSATYSVLMNLMASKAFPTVMTGRMGPKISSCITRSVGLTSTRIVGSMNFSSESVFPPTATVPFFKKFATRLRIIKFSGACD